ncbi:DUF167 domain-containing protein [Patescibacteria group bacterium]|nr:DUF167 domain-containing protein [Patescibacteria group bacterium]
MKITVNVHPNSKIAKIEKKEDDFVHVYVRSPAKEGMANKEAIEKLSEFYDLPKSSIKLINGEKSKKKVFEIEK